MPFVTLNRTDTAGELTLRYEIWERGDAKPTLLLIHELGGTLESLRGFGALLSEHFRVIAFDQRGAGLSEKPTAPFTLADLGADIGRFADALRVPRPFHVMGLAMGAVVALSFAVEHSESLASLVLCDGTHEITAAARDYLLDRAAAVRQDGMRVVADYTFKNAFRGLPNAAENPDWAVYRQMFIGNSPEAYALHSEALAGMALGPADFSRVRCRTLGLTGQHDFIWGPPVGAALAAQLPNAVFEVVEHAAHFPPIQATEFVAARVTRFISEGVETRSVGR